MALFEACCKEKIQQFEDTGSDEEDIWDEKDVTFAPEAQRRSRCVLSLAPPTHLGEKGDSIKHMFLVTAQLVGCREQ